MSECTDLTYYQRKRDLILNRAKDYYENGKERLRGQARGKQRNLSEEEEKKRENMEKTESHYVCRKETKIKTISKKLLRG